jgi:hypothetical protein
MRSVKSRFRVAWLVRARASILLVGVSPARAGRHVESVGAVPLFEGANDASQSAARTAAFEKAIWEAVMRVAEELRAADLAGKEARAAQEKQRQEQEMEQMRKERERATAQARNENRLDPVPFFGGDPNNAEGQELVEVVEPGEGVEESPTDSELSPREILQAALGDQARGYTNRYRISEDRGLRERLFTGGENPEVNSEYVVVAEVDVDVERVRKALLKAGVIDSVANTSLSGATRELRLVILDPLNYSLLTKLQKVIEEEMEHSSVLPLEFERGQAVLAVRSELGAETFARSLIRRLPAELHVKQATVRGDEIAMRFELRAVPETSDVSARGRR